MRVKSIVGLCAVLVLSFAVQGCLTDPKKEDKVTSSASINGKWLKMRMVSELSVGGTLTADTLDYDTADYSKEFLVIQGSTFLKVTYNLGTDAVDTTELEAHAIGSEWDLDDDTVTITRTGSVLKVVTTLGGGISTRDEYVLQTGSFPPADWLPDTTGTGGTGGNGSVQSYLLNREIYTDTDSTGTSRDTNDYAGRLEEAQQYLRIYADSLVVVNIDDTALLSDERVDAMHWLTLGGDTLTLAVNGNSLTVSNTYSDEFSGTVTTIRREYTRITVFPPANWNVTPPTNATAVTVDASPVTGTLGVGVANWYSFAAAAGKTYYLHTTYTTDSVDTYIRLYSSTGERLAWNDDDDEDTTGSYNAGLEWTAPASGTYYFSVRGYEDIAAGTYFVEVGKINVIAKRAAFSGVAKPKLKKH